MANPLRAIFDFEKREIPFAVLLFSFFFLVIAVFQILKPLKKGLFVEIYGADLELYAKLANILVAAAGVALFSFLYDKLKRAHVIYALCGFFILCFFLVIVSLPGRSDISIWGFYFLGDLETTLMVVAFWAYLTDLATSDQARRLFGVIGAGGVIGGWAGNASAGALLEGIGTEGLLFLSIGLMAGVALITFSIELLIRRTHVFEPDRKSESKPKETTWSALDGARLVLRSPYLAAIAGLMTCYEIASQVMDYQFSSLVESLSGVEATQAFIFGVFYYANLLSVVVQIFLVSFIMKRLGLVVALLILPLAIFGSSLAFLAIPTLFVASSLVISDNGLNYSIQQTSRESLYVITTPDEKYKARAFTNMFVQRLAKGMAIVGVIAVIFLGSSVRTLSLITLAAMGIMVWLSLYAGRRFERETKESVEHQKAA